MSLQYAICVKHPDPRIGWVPSLGCPPKYDTAPLAEALRRVEGALLVIRAHMDSTGKDLSPVFDLADADALLDVTEAVLSKLSQQQGSPHAQGQQNEGAES